MIDLSIYLVTDSAQCARHGRSVADTVVAAVEGGVTTVQVRAKSADPRETLACLESLSHRLPDSVAVILNDQVDVFLAARARGLRVTGVHLGQSDLPIEDARQLVGPDAIVGLTANTAAALTAAQHSSARVDYVGIGAVRATTSKADAPTAIGVDGVIALARHCHLPAVAIGGITPADLDALRTGGLAGAAVVSWVCDAADPQAAAAELTHAWKDTP